MKAQLVRERRENGQWAKAFAEACADGDIERFEGVADCLSNTVDGWRLAMKRVARLSAVSAEIRWAFQECWIERKSLPLRVGNRRVLADALQVLMPSGSYLGPSVQLYRGSSWEERRCRRYGFSWTRDVIIAKSFGENRRALPTGGVVLGTVAPADAILLFRKDEGHFDEREVVVDPFKLHAVTVVERLSPPVGS